MVDIQRKQILTTILAIGGFGINAVTRFQKEAKDENLGHLEYGFVDTSASDIPADIDTNRLFLIRSMDGGGKNAKLTYGQILPHVPAILQKFEPKDFTIVVISGGGGSGSSIGRAVISKLMQDGKNVIAVVVGSTTTKKEITNTISLVQSLRNFTHQQKRPLMLHYRENNTKVQRSQVDKDINSFLMLAALTFSSENKGMDTADLNNFVNYNVNGSFEPELSSFEFFSGSAMLEDGLVAQSALVLFPDVPDTADHDNNNLMLEYRGEGFLNQRRTKQLGDLAPLYAVAYTGEIIKHLAALEALKQRYEVAEEARKNEVRSVATTAAVKNDGMVW